MAATATAALLHRGGLSVDAASAAAPVVSREWGSSTVRDLQGLGHFLLPIIFFNVYLF